MDIHSVTIKDGGVSVLHGDGQRWDFKRAIRAALSADDRDGLFDLITRLEALAVQEQANSEAWCKQFSEETDQHTLHHVQDEAIIE